MNSFRHDTVLVYNKHSVIAIIVVIIQLKLEYILHLCVLGCFSRVRLFATLWTVARQAPLSMGFSRQEYWSGLPCPPPGDPPNPGTEPASPASPVGWVVLHHQRHLASPHFTFTSTQSTVLSFEVSKDSRHGSCCDGFKSREDREAEPQTQLQKWMCVSSSNMSRPGGNWGTWRKQTLLESHLGSGLLKCEYSLGNG